MRIHCIRHEVFEGLGCIEDWIRTKKFQLSYTRTFLDEAFPSTDDFDALIIMGGSASVYEELKYPWLRKEKKFIQEVILSGKYLIGICLGSQLIADAMGAKVYPGRQKEIGWYPLKFSAEARKILRFLPDQEIVFHWHGDTYDIPDGGINIGSSETTPNQGFLFLDRIMALQFHCEMTPDSLPSIVNGAADDLNSPGPTVQSGKKILSSVKYCTTNNYLMVNMLEYLIK